MSATAKNQFKPVSFTAQIPPDIWSVDFGYFAGKWVKVDNNIQSLLHVVAGCMESLDRYMWRHDSVLNYIATFLKQFAHELYTDITDFSSPSTITGEEMQPNLLIILDRSKMFVVEFTIGFEFNIAKNEVCKRNNYKNLTHSLKSNYDQVKYINLSSAACGILGKGSKPVFDLLEELKIPDNERHFLTK